MNPFYPYLIEQTQTERETFLHIPALQKGSRGDISLSAYQSFLTQAYYHVRHTTPLLMACGSRLSQKQEWLRNAIAEYIEEELGHQEWILNDIAATGMDAEKVRYGNPHPATEVMVAYAYDTIMRNNPLGFFGMVLVLEGTSVSLATHAAEKIRSRLGLPKQAFSYLNSHGSLDIEHMGFFEQLMNRITDDADQQPIIHAARMFYLLYGDIFRALPLD